MPVDPLMLLEYHGPTASAFSFVSRSDHPELQPKTILKIGRELVGVAAVFREPTDQYYAWTVIGYRPLAGSAVQAHTTSEEVGVVGVVDDDFWEEITRDPELVGPIEVPFFDASRPPF